MSKVEFGDFQTPVGLAREVCALLLAQGEKPEIVIEPTAGRGAFLLAAARAFPQAALRGWEINASYVAAALEALDTGNPIADFSVVEQDFFTCDWEAVLATHSGQLLILGNPPWVTNAGVSVINGANLPTKENFLGLRGIAARTGKSNFDISEWMLIRLLHALRGRAATLAMLCKMSTARKFLRYAWQHDGRIATASLYRIDAAEHFDASVEACLLHMRTGSSGPHEADVFPALAVRTPSTRIGLADGELVADIVAYRALRHMEGLCPFRWRSGVKHDCAAVMELARTADGHIATADGQRVDLEPDFLYPLLKCSDLANSRTTATRLVLITQRFVGDDTAAIAARAPRTWHYLQTHRDRFAARKSSIYRGRVPFALFGIGDYAFAPWKVAVSGLHRTGRFQVIGPHDGRPVFFDDASYYLAFEHEEDARLIADILNSSVCQRFLAALVFPDSKRPFTVDLLQRLNLGAIATEAGLGAGWTRLQRANYAITSDSPQAELVMEQPRSVR